VIVTDSNFEEVVGLLSRSGEYGLDCETTGLDFKARLFSIIIASREQSYYFNFHDYGDGTPVLPRSRIRAMQPVFLGQSIFYISNAKFDLRMLRHEGLEVESHVFCTNALGRVLKNNYFGPKAYSLESWAQRLGDAKDDAVMDYVVEHKLYSVENIPGKKKEFKRMRFWEVPASIMIPYGEKDAELHLKVGSHIAAGIKSLNAPGSPGNIQRLAENEAQLTKVCFDMEWAGIRIDRDYVRKAQAYEEEQISRFTERFRELSGETFRDSSSFLAGVFKQAGYTDLPTTDKGNPSFTDDNLDDLGGDLAQSVRDIRFHAKRVGTYYSSFLHYADGEDRIHPDMKQSGTETGRFSYADPNLQNVPKEENTTHATTPSIVRCSFVPDPGDVFVMVDYSQQEFRLMLDYAGETKLIDAINQGADVHQATADMLGISRQYAKTVNFALLYGAGPAKMARMLSIPEFEARDLRALYFGRLPRVQRFITQVIDRGRARGYVVNWAGRRCHIDSPDYAYILPNHLIQGGGADVIKFAMVQIHALLQEKTGGRSSMRLQVHDEVVFQFNPRDLELVPEIRRIMEGIYRPFNGMKLTTSCDHSWKSWGAPDKEKGLPGDETA